MMTFIEFLCYFAYFAPAVVLMSYGINQYVLLGLYFRRRTRARGLRQRLAEAWAGGHPPESWPAVVTQIPIYNEYNVAERAIRAAAAMQYPAGRHALQILDDSTDGTRDIVDRVVAELEAQGIAIEVIRRDDRTGYKAGALQAGMEQSSAPLFAIFDADFEPPVDFLVRTVTVLMSGERIGLVQARWGHLNRDTSLVTQAQGMGIDGHFAIEQGARAWNHLFMNFNGTAGLWRRSAIEDAGGWEHDTLTEDMDLSYRAQLAGWEPSYVDDLVVPAELPEDINAFKSQQFRWAKGSIQTAMKLLPRVMRAPVPAFAKIQAAFHMTHYMIHPIMVWLAVFALPLLLFGRLRLPPLLVAFLLAAVVTSAIAPFVMYTAAQVALYPRRERRLRVLPALSAVGVGIAISNSRAVLEALFGIDSPFVRTPKRGDRPAKTYRVRGTWIAVLEVALGLYCFYSLNVYLYARTFFVGPFLLLYGAGFTAVGLLSLCHRWRPRVAT